MSNLDRRDVLRLGLAGLAATPLSSLLAPLRAAALAGSPSGPAGKLLLIFLRGANDGVTTLVPAGDRSYPRMRIDPGSQAFIDPAAGIPLLNSTYAVMNPVMAPLSVPDLAGHVAWMHQIGNPDGLRSHFTEMQILETADPQPEHLLNDEGWIPRLAADQLFGATTAVPSCSNSTLMQRLFRTKVLTNLQIHIRDLAGLLHKLPDFRPRAPLESWMYSICCLELKAAIRAKSRRQGRTRALLGEAADQSEGVGDDLHDVHGLLQDLGGLEAEAIRLKHLEGLTFREMAERLALSANTAKTVYYRGLRAVREALAREEQSA